MTSDLRKLCREQYAARVAMRQDIPNELKRALKTHERVPVFIDNLSQQLNHPRIRADIKRETIIMAIHNLTDLYISNVMRMANEKHMSVLERSRIQKEQENLQLARDFVDSLIGEEEVSRDAKGNETVREVVEVNDLSQLEKLH
jgi:hypothetical protein